MQEPPFRFGQVVSDKYFVGRAAEIASLTVDLRTATNVVLISPRRFGKTSLVLRVLRELECLLGALGYARFTEAVGAAYHR